MRKLTALLALALAAPLVTAENTPAQNMSDIRTNSEKLSQTIVKMMCHNHPNPTKCKPLAESAVILLRQDDRNLQNAERAYAELLHTEVGWGTELRDTSPDSTPIGPLQ